MSSERTVPDEYLGDGVYAAFDGFSISLDLRGQDSTTMICLDPYVVGELEKFIEKCREASELAYEGGSDGS